MNHARNRARRSAVQALYQWQLTNQPLAGILQQFREEQGQSEKIDFEYFNELVAGVINQSEELDAALQPNLDRAIREINPVELAVVRLGTYELKNRIDIPYRVVINESVDLAKKFGADQSHRFVNGVLDKMAKTFRKVEVDAQKKSK